MELEPQSAGNLDTLAEVYFHRGDRAAAVKHSERAVELRPNGESLQQQLERFRTTPLP